MAGSVSTGRTSGSGNGPGSGYGGVRGTGTGTGTGPGDFARTALVLFAPFVPVVRLKLTILGHSSEALKLGRFIFWPLAVVATWAAVLLADGAAARRDVLMLVLAVWGAGWMLGPVLASGAGVLRPAYFALLPLNRRKLGLALLVAACVGYGPLVSVLSLAATSVHAVDLDPVAVPVALLAVPPTLLFMVALSRIVYAVMGSAMGSRLGVAISSVQYGLLVAVLLVGWLAVAGTSEGLVKVVREGLPGRTAAEVLGAFPTSWPVRAVEAAADGRPAPAAGWLLALTAAAAVMAGLCALLLTPRPSARTAGRGFRPLGSDVLTGRRRPVLPATPFGAVTGKELRQWWRDPWRSLELQCGIWTGVFVGVICLIADKPEILPFAGLTLVILTALASCNLLGQDGTAVWMTVVGAEAGTVRADIRGRQAALLILFGPLSFVMTAAGILVSGEHWAWPLVLSLLLSLFGAAVGVAVLLSVVAVTPGVDPKYRVGPNDAGDTSFQIWIGLYGTLIPALPTAAVAFTGQLTGAAWLTWGAVPFGLVNGAVAAWWLGRVAYRRLDSRLPETFVRLRYGKAIAAQQLAAQEARGWLDELERGSIKNNQERKPVGT